MNLQTFKSFNTDRATDIDELVAALAFGKSLRVEFDALQIEEPEYIDTTLKAVRREIASRNSDKVAARKRELTARIDALKSPTQKKKELEEELAKLEAMAV
jgi:ATP-dependent Lon protease